MKDLLNGWGITAAVFLPLVGALVMLAIPKSEETLHKVVALVTSQLAGKLREQARLAAAHASRNATIAGFARPFPLRRE